MVVPNKNPSRIFKSAALCPSGYKMVTVLKVTTCSDPKTSASSVRRCSHPLCLTNTCLMILLPSVPEGLQGQEPLRQETKRWEQARAKRKQVDEWNMNIRKRLECLPSWHTDCLGWVDFIPATCLRDIQNLLILRFIFPFLHVRHFVIMEKLGQTGTHIASPLLVQRKGGGGTFSHLHSHQLPVYSCWGFESFYGSEVPKSSTTSLVLLLKFGN